MIIRYPTGLYARQIPTKPSDVGNVTFTISSEEPSKSGLSFQLFPIAEQLKKRPSRVWTDEQRRLRYGDLAYTITFGGEAATGSVKKLFEIGQILEFTDKEANEVGVNTVPKRMELQHNTNLLDLSEFDLSYEEIASLTLSAAAQQKVIESEITDLQNKIADNKATVKDLQKTINEANKVLSALDVLGNSATIRAKVEKTRNDAYDEQQQIIIETNSQLTQVAQLRDELLKVSELVR